MSRHNATLQFTESIHYTIQKSTTSDTPIINLCKISSNFQFLLSPNEALFLLCNGQDVHLLAPKLIQKCILLSLSLNGTRRNLWSFMDIIIRKLWVSMFVCAFVRVCYAKFYEHLHVAVQQHWLQNSWNFTYNV